MEEARAVNDTMVAMRDGVRLATSVYLPQGAGPWPVVLKRTPYGKDLSILFEDDSIQRVAIRPSDTEGYTEAGYALVLQDVRGRFRSEGDYLPYEGEIEDGFDSVEWVAAQPFSNGRVGISGTSALGIHSNLAAAAAPPHLVAAFVVVAPASVFYQGRFIGGAFKRADGAGWMKSQGMSDEEIRAYAARAVLDERWLASDFLYHRHAVQVPIYNVGGWFDLFAAGSVDNFRYLQRYGAEGARGNQKLWMGAFGHGPVLAGDLAYPGEAGLDSTLDEELRWFDFWLKGEDNGIMREPPVTYYRMASARKGAASPHNGYQSAEQWPPAGSRPVRLNLGPAGRLSSAAPGVEESSTAYAYDPADPVPTVGGANLMLPIGPADQRAIGERRDYLRFEAAPLERAVTVAGEIAAELWVSTDAPDTDFVVKLVDVYPDGYEALLSDSILRARFRHGRRSRDVAFMEPGRIEKVWIDLGQTANRFEPGHRIALHVTSSNAPRFDPNPNTGAPLGGEPGEPRVANNVIHHDASPPSALVISVVEVSKGPLGGL
jgi:predicted acyl esterase